MICGPTFPSPAHRPDLPVGSAQPERPDSSPKAAGQAEAPVADQTAPLEARILELSSRIDKLMGEVANAEEGATVWANARELLAQIGALPTGPALSLFSLLTERATGMLAEPAGGNSGAAEHPLSSTAQMRRTLRSMLEDEVAHAVTNFPVDAEVDVGHGQFKLQIAERLAEVLAAPQSQLAQDSAGGGQARLGFFQNRDLMRVTFGQLLPPASAARAAGTSKFFFESGSDRASIASLVNAMERLCAERSPENYERVLELLASMQTSVPSALRIQELVKVSRRWPDLPLDPGLLEEVKKLGA